MSRSDAAIFFWFVWLFWKRSPCVRFNSCHAGSQAPNGTHSDRRLTSRVMELWSSLPAVIVCHYWAVQSWSEGHLHALSTLSVRCRCHCQWFCLTAKQLRQGISYIVSIGKTHHAQECSCCFVYWIQYDVMFMASWSRRHFCIWIL